MVITSLIAKFAKRQFVVVCICCVLYTIRTTNTFPINPMIPNGTEAQKRAKANIIVRLCDVFLNKK